MIWILFLKYLELGLVILKIWVSNSQPLLELPRIEKENKILHAIGRIMFVISMHRIQNMKGESMNEGALSDLSLYD